MLYLILFAFFSMGIFTFLKPLLDSGFSNKKRERAVLEAEFCALARENENLKSENLRLQKDFERTVALYNLASNICKSLDSGKIFEIFRESLRSHIPGADCRLISNQEEEEKAGACFILPLSGRDNQNLGCLAVSGLKESDREKFMILAQQFITGMRRAYLYHEVQNLTLTDTLTQVYNRRYFMQRFKEEFVRSQEKKLNFSFLMVDVDNFKQFNDTYGHLVGDVILRRVAGIIRETLRQIDFIGRYGGEELSIILVETDKQQAAFAAQRIRRAIESSRVKAYDEELSVTVSIGVSGFPADSLSMGALVERADQALYRAKTSGKNQVCFYSPPDL